MEEFSAISYKLKAAISSAETEVETLDLIVQTMFDSLLSQNVITFLQVKTNFQVTLVCLVLSTAF